MVDLGQKKVDLTICLFLFLPESEKFFKGNYTDKLKESNCGSIS
jgi:hypothetical protein